MPVKRWLLLLPLALLLTGCSLMVDSSYLSVEPYTEPVKQDSDEGYRTAENYLSLKNALLYFVEHGQEQGSIRVYDYSGDLSEDLPQAVEEVSEQDPLGAYAVDSMEAEAALIVAYQEVRVDIAFRRTPEQIESIEASLSMNQLRSRIEEAAAGYETAVTARVSYFTDEDVAAIPGDYYRAHPAQVMEMPAVTVNVYPEEGGYVRIVEVLMAYTHTAEELTAYRDAVETSARAAQEYVRYRETDTDKLQLLYTYLQERFSYVALPSATPAYSFLCDGIATSEGAARSLQIICDQMELECRTVEGSRGGKPWVWNLVNVDGVWCHVDLYRLLMDGSEGMLLWKDEAMTGYEWDREAYATDS